MARGRQGWQAVRQVAVGALVFAGVFVLCFGFGNGRQSLVVTGAVIAVLAFSARIASAFRRAPKAWVRGTGEVVEASDPPADPADSRFGRCSIELVVDAPGLPGETVLVHDSRVPVARWPRPGDTLPIRVAADDVRNVRVLWRDHLPGQRAAEPAWEDRPVADEPADEPAGRAAGAADGPEIDFDLDGPPTVRLPQVPVAAAAESRPEIGRAHV